MLTGSGRRLRRVLPHSTVPTGGSRLLAPSGRFTVVAAVVVGASVAGLLGGPVAAVVTVAYLGTAAHLTRRTRRDVAAQRRFGAALDSLADAAAALRAGIVTANLSLVEDDGLRMQAWAALSLSERTGAPLAELLERIEAQHRLAMRSAARAGSEAAGAATTAVLLAALPVGGVALGYLLGVDPARILLHTPLGAGCAFGAILLQLVGVAWVLRLVRPPGATHHREDGSKPEAGLRGPTASSPICRGSSLDSARRRISATLPGRLRRRRMPDGARPPSARREVSADSPGRRGVSGALVRSVLVAVGAGGLLAVCVGGVPGVVAGLLGAGGLLVFLLRAEPPERRRERESARRDLPLAIDLVAATLRAGAPLDHCLLAVAGSLHGPIADRLDRAGRSLALGAPVRDALRHLADLDGAARVVTAAERSSANGAALAGVLQRCAADLRDTDALAVETASRRAGVLIVLPLGLCFLPAFVLAGLVPVLIAFLGDLTL